MNECYEIQAYLIPILVPIFIIIIENITKKYEAKSFYISFSIVWLPLVFKEIFYEPCLIYSLFFINEPIYLLSYPLYYYSIRQYNLKKLTTVISCVLFMFCVNYIFRDKINDYQNFGSLSEIENLKIDTLKVLNQRAEKCNILLNKENKILIKYWNYSCPICIAEAPILDSFYLANNKLKIISIYLMSRDSVKEFNRFLEIKSTVNSYFLANSSEMNALEVTKFPTYIIFIKGKPIFKGNLENAMRIMKE